MLLHHYYILLHHILLLIITFSIITLLLHHYYILLHIHYYLLLRTHYYPLLRHYYVIITSLLRHYYFIIPNCVSMRNNEHIITYYALSLFSLLHCYYSLLLLLPIITCYQRGSLQMWSLNQVSRCATTHCWQGICRALALLAVGPAPGPGRLIVMPAVTVEHTALRARACQSPGPVQQMPAVGQGQQAQGIGQDWMPVRVQCSTLSSICQSQSLSEMLETACSTSLSDLSSVNSTIRLASE